MTKGFDEYPFGTPTDVATENIRNNQIDGETDGITPEVAADLGFGFIGSPATFFAIREATPPGITIRRISDTDPHTRAATKRKSAEQARITENADAWGR